MQMEYTAAAERAELAHAQDLFERRNAPLSADAIQYAELEVLGDSDVLLNAITPDRGQPAASFSAADKMLRQDHRSDDAPLDLLLAGLLISAHRRDGETTLMLAQKLAKRYLESQADYVAEVAERLS